MDKQQKIKILAKLINKMQKELNLNIKSQQVEKITELSQEIYVLKDYWETLTHHTAYNLNNENQF